MSNPWLKHAPVRLVSAVEGSERIKGRTLLRRLLRDEGMAAAWKTLTRKVGVDEGKWLDVWRSITYAKVKSKKSRLRKRPSEERDEYEKISRRFGSLAKTIQDRDLDVLAYELLSADTLAALHLDLEGRDSIARSDAAHEVLDCWPHASEILRGLERLAKQRAADAMERPRGEKRARGDVEVRSFVRHLGPEFHRMFGTPLYGTIAVIATVVFDKYEAVNRGTVQQVLRNV